MSGKRRVVSFGAAFVGFVLVSGCGAVEEDGSCGSVCEKIAALECGPPEDECLEDCRDAKSEVGDACKGAFQEYLSCLDDVEFRCNDAPCGSPDGEGCSSGLVVDGCEAELDVLNACDDRDDPEDCDKRGGGAAGLTGDGRTIDYSYEVVCVGCTNPMPGIGAQPLPCASAFDCPGICCACTSTYITAQACLDGICASAGEACDASLGICDGL